MMDIITTTFAFVDCSVTKHLYIKNNDLLHDCVISRDSHPTRTVKQTKKVKLCCDFCRNAVGLIIHVKSLISSHGTLEGKVLVIIMIIHVGIGAKCWAARWIADAKICI